jgi:hypothetical protein
MFLRGADWQRRRDKTLGNSIGAIGNMFKEMKMQRDDAQEVEIAIQSGAALRLVSVRNHMDHADVSNPVTYAPFPHYMYTYVYYNLIS